MAGIGFELRKLLNKDSYFGLLQGYGYAGIISSGPWVLSILGILIVGLLSQSATTETRFISQFQTSVTYLIAGSLTISGAVQLAYTRFIADTLFLKHEKKVIPTFHAITALTSFMSGLIASPLVFYFLQAQNTLYQLLMIVGFVILCNIWVTATLLSGLKAYKPILSVFAVAYSVIVVMAFFCKYAGLNGLLFAFVFGHCILFSGMVVILYRQYPLSMTVDFSFMSPKKMFPSLIWTGFIYNFAVWIDKLIFWYYPATSIAVIGTLRASLIYDIPIFLAYLTIIPGMAVLLVRMETDFVEAYDQFYSAVRDGGTLRDIQQFRNEMVLIGRQGLFDIIKIQGLTVLIVFVIGPGILSALNISQMYYDLLCIDVVGTGLQVVLLGLLNVLFYLDKRRHAALICSIFAIGNALFTWLSLQLGAFYFGYGFTIALLFAIAVGFYLLNDDFEKLEYETFMLQTLGKHG